MQFIRVCQVLLAAKMGKRKLRKLYTRYIISADSVICKNKILKKSCYSVYSVHGCHGNMLFVNCQLVDVCDKLKHLLKQFICSELNKGTVQWTTL